MVADESDESKKKSQRWSGAKRNGMKWKTKDPNRFARLIWLLLLFRFIRINFAGGAGAVVCSVRHPAMLFELSVA